MKRKKDEEEEEEEEECKEEEEDDRKKGVTVILTSAHGLRLLRLISVILLSRHTVVVGGSPTLGLLSAATIDLSLF